ncbi:hypothetical protein EV714DRAFT_204320 [Schizophyllum commune]
MPDFVCLEKKCSISGAKTGLSIIRLISPYKLVNATDEEMARMEWAWGMERGGLDYYLSSAPNNIILRDDIAEMYANAEIVLLPTHKTFQDAMEFRERAGYSDRDEEDRFLLRPMTALGRVFRYVFIPITDAAEELSRRIPLQRQTDEDWNGGIHPYSGTVMDPCWRQYSVVEIHCHPVSICYYARMVLDIATLRGWAIDIWPWRSCLTVLEEQWGIGRRSRAPPAPQWFVELPTREDDDESLPESQQTGYWPLLGSKANSLQRMPGCASLPDVTDSETSSRILEWLKDLPQRKVPPRRSARVASMPTIPGAHASSVRKVKSANTRKGSAPREEPGWSRQKGQFPTHRFTSNDWALFCFGAWLSEDDDGYTRTR